MGLVVGEYVLEVPAERAEEWVAVDSASVPSVGRKTRTSPGHRVSTNAAPPVVPRWCGKARLTTRRSKAAVPDVQRRAERRASCQGEIEPDRWATDL